LPPTFTERFEQIVGQLPGYEHRPQQVEMARLIARAIRDGKHALVEAGTGCGKTMAYLLPLLANHKKTIVCTGTIALQTQLMEKDLVFLSKALPFQLKFAIAKGRGNYLCLRKLLEAERSIPPGSADFQTVARLRELLRAGEWDGDVGNLPFSVPSRLWAEELASTHEECGGNKCAFYGECPYRRARRRWEDADVLVANHALYFMHLATGGAVLPKPDVVVFDEAHHIEEYARRSLAVEISRGSTRYLITRVERRLRALPRQLSEALVTADNRLVEWVDQRGWRSCRITDLGELPQIAEEFSLALAQLEQWIRHVDAGQFQLFGDTPEMARAEADAHREVLLQLTLGLRGRWRHFADLPTDGAWVHWLEADQRRQQFTILSSPLSVADALGDKLWNANPTVLTSATLAVANSFHYLCSRIGLPEELCYSAVLDSPFDYAQQAILYLPRSLPEPNDPTYNQAIAPLIEAILRATDGRAFVLCTSHKSLNELHSLLADRLPFPCRSQQEMPRGALLDWFKSEEHPVLFATASFWEGVDVPGQNLSCVVIDRIPFTHPDDPVHQATVESLKADGRDWFTEYALPKAVLTLKQGFGRLIRTKRDRGLVAILDPRLTRRYYGRTILASLPPACRTNSLDPEELRRFLSENGAGE